MCSLFQVASLNDNQRLLMDSVLKEVHTLSYTVRKTSGEGQNEVEQLRKRHREEVESLLRQRDEQERARTLSNSACNRDNYGSTYSRYLREHAGTNNSVHAGGDDGAAQLSYTVNRGETALKPQNAIAPCSLSPVSATDKDCYHCDNKELIPPFPSPLAWTASEWTKGNSFDPVYDFGNQHGRKEEKINIQFSSRNPNSLGFVSPLTGIVKSLNSKELFRRHSPSPIAAVRPQIQKNKVH